MYKTISVKSSLIVRVISSLLLLFSLAFSINTQAEELEQWHLYTSDNWRLYTDRDESEALQVLQDFQVFRATIIQLIKGNVSDKLPPVTIYLFETDDIWDELGFSSNTAAVFRNTTHGPQMIIGPADDDEDTLQFLYHEYVHYLVSATAPIRYADWYNEGIADFFSTTVIGEDYVYIGKIHDYRAETLSTRGMLAPDDMFAIEDVYSKAPRLKNRFYASAWIMTHYFTLGARNGFPSYYNSNAQFLTLLSQGVDVDTAFEQSFTISYRDLKRELIQYARSDRKDGIVLPRPAINSTIKHRMINESEAKGVLSILLGWGDDEDSELGPLFLAEAANGGDTFAMSALAMIFSGAENEDSVTWLNKVIASEDLDQNTKYNIAETYLNLAERAEDDQEAAGLFEQAVYWWKASNQPNDYLPSLINLGMHYAIENHQQAANDIINRLLEHPSNHIIAPITVAQIHLEFGQYDSARQQLLAAYDRAGHTRWLRERIQVLLADPRLNSEKSLEKTD